QPRLELVHSTRVLILLWRHAKEALERSLQMRRAQSDVRRQLAEGNCAIGMRVEKRACALDRRRASSLSVFRARVASQTGAKAGLFGGVWICEEVDIGAQRAARHARWP